MNKSPQFKTTCSYCGVGCGIVVSKTRNNKLEVEGDPSHPVNRGMLCSKGRNLHYTVMDQSDRLTHPQMRWSKSHPMERTDWDTVMKRTTAVFKSIIQKYGPDSVGFYVSGQCLTEEYYLINKLVKGFLGTNNIDTNSRLCMSSAVVGYKQVYGEDSVPISYEDIDLADCFLIAGANPAWCHPILFRRLEQRKETNPDAKIIVVDPRVTDSCHLADLHVQLKPGTDVVFFQAVGRVLIEQGAIDVDFINQFTDGYDLYRKEVFNRTSKEASVICEIPLDDILQTARYIGNATGFITMWAMGLNQSTEGVNKNLALLNLNNITGHIGKAGSGPFSLTGQPNAMGGREVGGMANLLAVHKNLNDPEHRAEVASFWGVDQINKQPGLSATKMFEALESGKMKAIWVICTNPSVSMPNARKIDEALKKASFVVVQDISKKSDTIAYADVILPAASWLEKEGTMTNSERRISYLPKVVNAPGEALPDAEIILRFAKQMGFHGFDFKSMDEVYQEYCRMTKGTNIDVSGLTYNRLKNEGSMQWPVPDLLHKGTERLFEDYRFFTPNQKVQIKTSGAFEPAEKSSPQFPLILTTGRIRDQWHTMTKTGKVNKLNQQEPVPFLEIHPEDAYERGIKENDPVVIKNDRGSVRVNAKVTDTIKRGVVFLPMHWGKVLQKDHGRANNITSTAIDPVSSQPGFKFSAVSVEKFRKAKQKVVLIGAGAAAFRFINSYRELNAEDELHVFSKEEWPFYDRVLLPDYVTANKSWEDLLKFKYGEFERLNTHLYVSNKIVSIDRNNKTVMDDKGESHTYDVLIMATGSRSFVPGGVPMYLPGVFTMRDRKNADDLKKHLEKVNPIRSIEKHLVIVGGGLLGLELAAAMAEVNVKVSIIQLGSRLMERQLDPIASSLLRQYIEDDLNIRIITNDEVKNIDLLKDADGLQASLKSGLNIACDALVYAIGTRPNSELGKEIGLETARGIKVNDHLQTSDSAIFALGEIAEHNQKLNGITAAAEQQADICARFIAGDQMCRYKGSTPMNILKFPNLDLCSIGLSEIPVDGKGYDEILFLDRSELYYKKCIIKDDRLVGAILLGDKGEFAEFKQLIDHQTELSEKRLQLLRSGKVVEPIVGELICSCNNVGDGNLLNAIANGSGNLNEICQQTGAGLGCGSCKPAIKRILENSKEVIN